MIEITSQEIQEITIQEIKKITKSEWKEIRLMLLGQKLGRYYKAEDEAFLRDLFPFKPPPFLNCELWFKCLKIQTRTLATFRSIAMHNFLNCSNQTKHLRWKRRIHERDKYECKHCGANRNLQAHHIKSKRVYPEEQFEIENGITLCKDCHKKEHRRLYEIH